MKKTVKSAIALILIAVMVFVPFAVVPEAVEEEMYQSYVRSRFNHIVKVSYDEVRYGFKPNGSDEKKCITCGGKTENIDTPHLPQNTQSAIFWGWISADGSDIESFSYVQEGLYTLSLEKFKVNPEAAGLRAAPGEFTQRSIYRRTMKTISSIRLR